ncbi:outer membrane receptor protein involved in Fe transport [Caulobacter sp. BE264]|uniref:outer membrane beta-barrel family protein n=1 Tax=Caulobacter sp. BE264 TaxID=2817724 RepID=UPI002860ED09|nr:outer membrane beta-barrel family protein [Caulobacter sp. BE264]MDR7231083.1 outer membrane receptor protein involved in Fe transport [Caulobacter sp. BE264]
MRLKFALLAAAAVIAPPALGLAQTAPAPSAPAQTTPAKPSDAPTAVEGVVIRSDATAMRTDIDRRSYSVANDLSAKTGSISDALRNVPSVEVDVQGNVSLRGDSNVTILIDGKPSGMFNGDNRADALQQLPADQIDRVEVMTNPSAAYRPDGSAGVINLITKKTQKAGVTGTVRANVGPDGRYNGGISAQRREGKVTLSGDASYRYDRQEVTSIVDRQSLNAAGAVTLDADQTAEVLNKGGALSLRTGVDYDLDKKTRLSAEVRYRGMDYEGDGRETYLSRNAAGVTQQAYLRDSTGVMIRDNAAIAGDYRRQFTGAGHELTSRAEYEITRFKRGGEAFADYTAGAPDLYEGFSFGSEQKRANWKLDYTKPLADQAKLKTGLDFEAADNDYNNYGARGTTLNGQTVDPARTNRFTYDQDVFAAYVTYERPFGDLTVQTGLRAEQVEIRTDQITSGQKGENDYLRLYPTLNAGYRINDANSLSAGFSRRVARPGAQDLNPYPIYQDPYNFRAGNPNLKPQVTDSFELGWQYRKGPTTYLATAFYRDTRDGVTDVVKDLGGGVFLTTRENLAKSRNGGLEFVVVGRLTPKLTYNVSGQAFWNEIDAASLGFTGKRSDTSLSGRANLNYQATPKDFFQINAFTSGRRITPQGYREPFEMINLGYRRKVNDKLNFVVTVNDVVDSFKIAGVTNAARLRDRNETKVNVRTAFIGFSYAFGGGKPRPEQFDFSTGGPN